MHITAADLAFMKGESVANRVDMTGNPLDLAARYGYCLPGSLREAFVAGLQSGRHATAEGDARAIDGRSRQDVK